MGDSSSSSSSSTPSFLPVEQLLFGRAAGERKSAAVAVRARTRKAMNTPLRRKNCRVTPAWKSACPRPNSWPGEGLRRRLPRPSASVPRKTPVKRREACGGLKYVSPWAWRVHLDETSGLITVVPPVGAALYFNVQAGSDTALPAGISASATSGAAAG